MTNIDNPMIVRTPQEQALSGLRAVALGEPYDCYEDFDEIEQCDVCGLDGERCTCHECGRLPDGTCMLAGTEFCDWECKSK